MSNLKNINNSINYQIGRIERCIKKGDDSNEEDWKNIREYITNIEEDAFKQLLILFENKKKIKELQRNKIITRANFIKKRIKMHSGHNADKHNFYGGWSKGYWEGKLQGLEAVLEIIDEEMLEDIISNNLEKDEK